MSHTQLGVEQHWIIEHCWVAGVVDTLLMSNYSPAEVTRYWTLRVLEHPVSHTIYGDGFWAMFDCLFDSYQQGITSRIPPYISITLLYIVAHMPDATSVALILNEFRKCFLPSLWKLTLLWFHIGTLSHSTKQSFFFKLTIGSTSFI